ncbi:hypothetical protein IU510_20570 [Nocardia cyriacigeorgica]|uniref:hypothetical protein n=1 Tax=Nocardia cyriacigeorgica TaxID=135487 RepID=UPI00189570B4|nr:hypothetical protein [Nocardia cyriacigeorgica]MBF6100456.1 hypothetical protein [Nocardia cyriacigeorgica]MBF6320290.1 hypothetical protein [Nocardia cyriacigeorgica]MBF6346334.1 hypothetical protein [Nocardia cyriacigeorgica]MBF6534224.1 hypothetical protein [Nocardia cyriacigeorgica]
MTTTPSAPAADYRRCPLLFAQMVEHRRLDDQSTVALLALAHSANTAPHTDRSQPEPDEVSSSEHASVPGSRNASAEKPMLERVRTPRDSAAPVLADFAAMAELLCARDTARRRDPMCSRTR